MNRKPLPVASSDGTKPGLIPHNSIPGLFIEEDNNKKKVKKEKPKEPKQKKEDKGN